MTTPSVLVVDEHGQDEVMSNGFPNMVAVYALHRSELDDIEAVLGQLARTYGSAEESEFQTDARRIAFSSLPVALLRLLNRFYRMECAPAVAVIGFSIDDAKIGPTPPHWNRQQDRRSSVREELFFSLIGSVLGDMFGWSTLQDGHLIHNVVPIPGQEYEQSGHGSHALLAWHTEDGFHPYRCDYLELMALRNHDRIPTTFASVESLHLTPAQRDVLSEPRFIIWPDNEHLNQRQREGSADAAKHESISDELIAQPPTSVLFGDPRRPYLRIDPTFMSAVPGDREAERSLQAIVHQLEAALENLVLEPGTICIIDNYRAIHGRAAFRPRYDGTDRWLKKALLTRDLRKSETLREDIEKPVLTPVRIVLDQVRRAGNGNTAERRD